MKHSLAITCAALGSVVLGAQPRLTGTNVDQVLSAMTLEEKATLVVGSGWGSMIAGITGGSLILVPGAAGTTQGVPRLGVPQTVLADGPAGLRINPLRPDTGDTFYCTGFPVGTVLASTWNTPLVEEMTTAMGNEVLEYGVDVLLAPGMNIHRNPLCGRNFEYFSEDPLLSGKMGAAYVRGIQSNGVGTSVKHYAGNNQETMRMGGDSRISQRALREIYLKGFEITVKESDPWTIMSSYNKINGTITQQDRDLLTTILRDEWGFGGIVMTDWTSKRNTPEQIVAGNDLMEPGDPSQTAELVQAVKSGILKESDLDVCVRRILEYIVRTPRFKGYKYSDKPDLKAHAEVARRAAGEGLVLLKNDDCALPLGNAGKVALYGTGAYETVAGGTGSGNVNKAYIVSIREGLEKAGFSVDKSIADYYTKYIAFQKADMANRGKNAGILLGDPVIPDFAVSSSFIRNKVKDTDMAIYVITRNAGEGEDRKLDNDFNLTAAETDLIRNLSTYYRLAGKKFVVVLNIGGVIETASWVDYADAVLLAWTPGQEAGHVVADVLTGKVNPSGKLPMTFPVEFLDHPSSRNFPFDYEQPSFNPFGGFGKKAPVRNADYTIYEEGIYVGYRYFNTAGKKVSYPFGYGLSYTTFEYSAPVVKVGKDGTVTASVTVANTGSVAGKEVVQVYVSAPKGGIEKPESELRAFAKTKELAPGEKQTLTFTIDPYTLASFDEAASEWRTDAGTYVLKFSADALSPKASATFKLGKSQSWPVHNVMAPESPIAELSLQ
ncbi:MAG: glycoside hydrolase family 3 C-terminal domain-containing protein [Candidatus Cryptobacteroides sp.]